MSLCGAIFSLLNGQSIICLSNMHFCCRARDFHVNVSMNSGPEKTKLFSCMFLQKKQTNSSCAKARSHVEWLGSSGQLSHLCVCATQRGVGAFSLGWFSPFHRAGLQVDLEATAREQSCVQSAAGLGECGYLLPFKHLHSKN